MIEKIPSSEVILFGGSLLPGFVLDIFDTVGSILTGDIGALLGIVIGVLSIPVYLIYVGLVEVSSLLYDFLLGVVTISPIPETASGGPAIFSDPATSDPFYSMQDIINSAIEPIAILLMLFAIAVILFVRVFDVVVDLSFETEKAQKRLLIGIPLILLWLPLANLILFVAAGFTDIFTNLSFDSGNIYNNTSSNIVDNSSKELDFRTVLTSVAGGGGLDVSAVLDGSIENSMKYAITILFILTGMPLYLVGMLLAIVRLFALYLFYVTGPIGIMMWAFTWRDIGDLGEKIVRYFVLLALFPIPAALVNTLLPVMTIGIETAANSAISGGGSGGNLITVGEIVRLSIAVTAPAMVAFAPWALVIGLKTATAAAGASVAAGATGGVGAMALGASTATKGAKGAVSSAKSEGSTLSNMKSKAKKSTKNTGGAMIQSTKDKVAQAKDKEKRREALKSVGDKVGSSRMTGRTGNAIQTATDSTVSGLESKDRVKSTVRKKSRKRRSRKRKRGRRGSKHSKRIDDVAVGSSFDSSQAEEILERSDSTLKIEDITDEYGNLDADGKEDLGDLIVDEMETLNPEEFQDRYGRLSDGMTNSVKGIDSDQRVRAAEELGGATEKEYKQGNLDSDFEEHENGRAITLDDANGINVAMSSSYDAEKAREARDQSEEELEEQLGNDKDAEELLKSILNDEQYSDDSDEIKSILWDLVDEDSDIKDEYSDLDEVIEDEGMKVSEIEEDMKFGDDLSVEGILDDHSELSKQLSSALSKEIDNFQDAKNKANDDINGKDLLPTQLADDDVEFNWEGMNLFDPEQYDGDLEDHEKNRLNYTRNQARRALREGADEDEVKELIQDQLDFVKREGSMNKEQERTLDALDDSDKSVLEIEDDVQFGYAEQDLRDERVNRAIEDAQQIIREEGIEEAKEFLEGEFGGIAEAYAKTQTEQLNENLGTDYDESEVEDMYAEELMSRLDQIVDEPEVQELANRYEGLTFLQKSEYREMIKELTGVEDIDDKGDIAEAIRENVNANDLDDLARIEQASMSMLGGDDDKEKLNQFIYRADDSTAERLMSELGLKNENIESILEEDNYEAREYTIDQALKNAIIGPNDVDDKLSEYGKNINMDDDEIILEEIIDNPGLNTKQKMERAKYLDDNTDIEVDMDGLREHIDNQPGNHISDDAIMHFKTGTDRTIDYDPDDLGEDYYKERIAKALDEAETPEQREIIIQSALSAGLNAQRCDPSNSVDENIEEIIGTMYEDESIDELLDRTKFADEITDDLAGLSSTRVDSREAARKIRNSVDTELSTQWEDEVTEAIENDEEDELQEKLDEINFATEVTNVAALSDIAINVDRTYENEIEDEVDRREDGEIAELLKNLERETEFEINANIGKIIGDVKSSVNVLGELKNLDRNNEVDLSNNDSFAELLDDESLDTVLESRVNELALGEIIEQRESGGDAVKKAEEIVDQIDLDDRDITGKKLKQDLIDAEGREDMLSIFDENNVDLGEEANANFVDDIIDS